MWVNFEISCLALKTFFFPLKFCVSANCVLRKE